MTHHSKRQPKPFSTKKFCQKAIVEKEIKEILDTLHAGHKATIRKDVVENKTFDGLRDFAADHPNLTTEKVNEQEYYLKLNN